ncbi:DUF4307 domain-containing protein [Nocardia camponoti]|uniref:DUF4307 domain-containing protein n=1 Tax=Nocardia camponoti TaxID=1616106 RepID=A0A917QFL9_9NOCA|nr:DUF4307 domain-containing protein [Nocardia camponoti]GGK48248.1 hypothetical protein GCM10011591_19500 [Nocardia camponoti]
MTTPEPDATTAQARHADRYGTRTPVRRRTTAVLVGAAVLAAGAGVAFLGYQKYGPKSIETEQLGYTVVDDSTIAIKMKVTRDHPEQAVVCFVRAMDADAVEVGRREVLISGGNAGTVQVDTIVKASSRPAAGDIYGCSAHVPDYLRTSPA